MRCAYENVTTSFNALLDPCHVSNEINLELIVKRIDSRLREEIRNSNIQGNGAHVTHSLRPHLVHVLPLQSIQGQIAETVELSKVEDENSVEQN